MLSVETNHTIIVIRQHYGNPGIGFIQGSQISLWKKVHSLKNELRSAIGAQRPNFCNGRTDKKNLEPKHLLMCFEALS